MLDLPEGTYHLAIQTPDGGTLNRRGIKAGMNSQERLSLFIELLHLMDGWVYSGYIQEPLRIKLIRPN